MKKEIILPEKIFKSNNFVDVKALLFKLTQENYDVKTTTGIKKDVKMLVDTDSLIKITKNFKDNNDKMKLIKLLEIKEISYKVASQIFEEGNLLKAIKEFDIKVTRDELEELYKTLEGKDKEFLGSLLKMNIATENTITEIALDNLNDEGIIDYIKEYDLKLNLEELNDIISRFKDKEISPENREFIDIVTELSKKNDELTDTINYQIIGKSKELQKFLPIITCYEELQEEILELDDNKYKAFSLCLNSYASKTQDWTPVAVDILRNIKQYTDLIDGLNWSEIQENNKIELLTKLLAEPNYFNITNIDEYLKKRDMVCETILKALNNKDLEEFSLIAEMTEKDRIKFAVLEKNFGLSLEQAQVLINKFGDDIESISELGENAIYYRGLIRSLKFICDDKNINKISEVSFETENRVIDVAVVERDIKDIYDKDNVFQLYRPKEEDFEREEDGIKIYKAGKSTDGKFIMETHSPGAVYEADKSFKEGKFKESWNRPKLKSQAFCTVTCRQDMLIATNIPVLEYGFYDFEEGSLRGSGYEDVSSESKLPVIFLDEDEKYCNVDTKINKTRNINENDRSRVQSNGTKKQPDYIRYRKSKFIPKELSDAVWESSKEAAKQFGIPIVIVDQDECTKRENEELQNMLNEFNETKDAELISKIIVKFENNRKGNDWGINENLKRPWNTDFEIDDLYGSPTISRNEMLLSLIASITACKDLSTKKTLYETLNTAIEDEIKKIKIPEPKIINEIAIPVVRKKQMDRERYFSISRNKNTREYQHISSYYKMQELSQDIDREISKKEKKVLEEETLPLAENFFEGLKRLSENEIARNIMNNQREINANYREYENPNINLDNEILKG